jgi:hypothetical protein
MVKCCRTCAFFAHQVIENKVYLDGKCIHIAFIRAGMSKIGDNGEQILLNKDINSITYDEIIEAHRKGYIFYDFIKILGHRLKVCDHWMSQLSFANGVFEEYNDKIWNYVKFEGVFRDWFIQGCPLEDKEFKNLEKKQDRNGTYKVKEVPETYLKYESCVTCVFFKYKVKDGTIEPFKGECSVDIKSKDKLKDFKDNKDGNMDTYSFLGCKKHKSLNLNVFNMADKLKYFIGINPIEYRIVEIKNIYKHPFITQKVKNSIESIREVDLNKLLLNKYNFNRWKEFKNLESFKVIGDSFRDNLRRCRKIENNYGDSNKIFE